MCGTEAVSNFTMHDKKYILNVRLVCINNPSPALVRRIADSSVWPSNKNYSFFFLYMHLCTFYIAFTSHYILYFICHCGLKTYIFRLNSPWCYQAHMWPLCSFCNPYWFLWHDFLWMENVVGFAIWISILFNVGFLCLVCKDWTRSWNHLKHSQTKININMGILYSFVLQGRTHVSKLNKE